MALLAGTYAVMVERMNPATQDRAKSFLASQVGAHLISRLWHGRLLAPGLMARLASCWESRVAAVKSGAPAARGGDRGMRPPSACIIAS